MNTRLNHIHNWPELAQQANWSAALLANECGVSLRTLERFFRKQMGNTPKAWLSEQRQKEAAEFLRNGASVKEAAFQFGYRYAHHFSREFKAYWGVCPTSQTTRIAL
jgi:AraC-like DNA-binding protein